MEGETREAIGCPGAQAGAGRGRAQAGAGSGSDPGGQPPGRAPDADPDWPPARAPSRPHRALRPRPRAHRRCPGSAARARAPRAHRWSPNALAAGVAGARGQALVPAGGGGARPPGVPLGLGPGPRAPRSAPAPRR